MQKISDNRQLLKVEIELPVAADFAGLLSAGVVQTCSVFEVSPFFPEVLPRALFGPAPRSVAIEGEVGNVAVLERAFIHDDERVIDEAGTPTPLRTHRAVAACLP